MPKANNDIADKTAEQPKTERPENEQPKAEQSETKQTKSAENSTPINIDAIIKVAEEKGRESYRKKVMELDRICTMANMPQKLGYFVEQDMSVEEVREELMQLLAGEQAEEVYSQITPVQSKQQENPVVEAAKTRAAQA